jgi:DnaJ-class molecular chaperone
MADSCVFDLKDNTALYTVLGVSTTASESEIKRAYYKLSLLYHPDKNPDGADRFKEISFANGILSDPEQRRMYDNKTLRTHIEGKARAYDPMMDPNVELTADQLRNFAERIRNEERDQQQRKADFEKRRDDEMRRRQEYEQKNPNFKPMDIPTTCAAVESYKHQQKTTADMLRALDALHGNEARRTSSMSDLDALKYQGSSTASNSLKAKMMSDFRSTRQANGKSTVEDVCLPEATTAAAAKKLGLHLPKDVENTISYKKKVEHVVKTRSGFNYRAFVERDLVDGGVLGDAILADALAEYDPNN